MTDLHPEPDIPASQQAVFTRGSTMKHVITMTLAGAIGLISVFAVDVMNLFYISLLGDDGLTAAIGYVSTIMFFTISLSIGLTIAATAIVSRSIGAGEGTLAKAKSGTMIAFVVALNIVTAIVLYPLLPLMLEILGAKNQTFEAALEFMRVVVLTIPLMGLGMCCSGLLRARGDARRAMYVTLSAGIVAAMLDPLLILYFELGLTGAAYTTAIARVALAGTGIYGVLLVHKMVQPPNVKLIVSLIRPFAMIAVPATLTQIATPFGNAYMTAIMSDFGDAAVAGWAIIGRLVPLAFVAIFTLSAAVGPILGQNLGAQRFDRINRTMRDSLLFAMAYTMVVWLLLALFADTIIEIFGAQGEAASLVKFFTLVIGGTYLFQGGLFVANAAFNNLGYPMLSTVFNWGRATIGTIPFVWAGSYWGPNGALAGFGLGGVTFGLLAVVVCFRVIQGLPQQHGHFSDNLAPQKQKI